MIDIPRKFQNSKGNNFYTEISNTKKWNKLFKEVKDLNQAQRYDKKQANNTKHFKG